MSEQPAPAPPAPPGPPPPRPFPAVAAVCVSLVLLGLAGTIYKIHFPPGPIADEAAYVMMTESLWHDRDLGYDIRDLTRAYRIWDQGPNGMILFTDDGGRTMFYGKPYLYSLAALPFYLVFGVQGLIVFNMALYLAMLWVAWWLFGRRVGKIGLFLGGFFFASVSFVYVFWTQPEVFQMALVFAALAIWWWLRQRQVWGWRELLLAAAAGAAIAGAFVVKEPTVLFGLPIGVDLLWQRRWKGVLAFGGAALVTLALLVGVQWKLTGHPSPYRGVQRRSFETKYPLEAQEDLWALYKGTSFGSWSGIGVSATPRVFLRDLVYFLFGRHTGLLPYFPFALFAVGLYLAGPRDRSGHLVLAAIVAYCLLLLLLRPHNYHGGAGFLGNRYLASIYPAFLFLPAWLSGTFRARWSLALPFAAAGLWTAAVVAVPVAQVAPEFGLQVHTRAATFEALPLELTLLPDGRLPGYATRGWAQGVWVVPRHNFSVAENHPNGVWVRGASSSEVYVISPVPIEALSFHVFSPLPHNTLILASDRERIVIPFDREENRAGAAVELPVELAAKDLGYFGPDRSDYYYRFRLETTDGWLPVRTDPKSTDYRYLSVFLSFNGQPP